MGRIRVAVHDEGSGVTLDLKRLKRLAERALRAERTGADMELSVALVDRERMVELNRKYLGREGATDVLAFPMDETDEEPGRNLLGDVVICPAVIQERAETYQVRHGDEPAYSMLHGLLHLLGYDHTSEEENEEMDRRVIGILEKAGGEL